MRYPKVLYLFVKLLILTLTALIFVPSVLAGTYKVLHAFSNTPDGAGLFGRLALDAKGNVYGATTGGGAYGEGTVFQLAHSPDGGGHWTETVVHSFCADSPQCSDGVGPFNGVTIDAAGNLYGTNTLVFQLAPGGWNFSVIYDSGSTGDMVVDGAGSLYVEWGLGGICHGGEIAKLKPPPDGGEWIPKDLYDFCLDNNQWSKGQDPNYALSWDTAGNLYGVTGSGGKANLGVVFQLEHVPSGWKAHVLHNFHGPPDGFFSQGGVVVDDQGRVYGATEQGGTGCGGGVGCGVIYQVTKQPDGHWKEKILHDFPNTKNGSDPLGTLAIDVSGSVYGVANGGGGPCGQGGCGVVYKMVHNPDDSFTYQVLHRFQGTDGLAPVAGVILDAKGNIYGTTSTGGSGGYGVVFKITQ